MTRVRIKEIVNNEQIIRLILQRIRQASKRKRIVPLRFRQWFSNHIWSRYFLNSNSELMNDPTKRIAKQFRRYAEFKYLILLFICFFSF